MVKLNDPRLKQMEEDAYDADGDLKPGWGCQVGCDDDGDLDVLLFDEYALALELGHFSGSREEYEVNREREMEEWLRIRKPLERGGRNDESEAEAK